MLTLWQAGCALPPEETVAGPNCRLKPQNAQDRLLIALAELLVPGYDTDPSGAPGAAQTCVLDLLYDDRYPAKGFVALIAGVIESKSKTLHAKSFTVLSIEQRMEVTLAVAKDLPPVAWFYKFIRSAYYTDDSTWLGLNYFGYRLPPDNQGWHKDPAFSLRKPVGKEMTDTGYLP